MRLHEELVIRAAMARNALFGLAMIVLIVGSGLIIAILAGADEGQFNSFDEYAWVVLGLGTDVVIASSVLFSAGVLVSVLSWMDRAAQDDTEMLLDELQSVEADRSELP